MPLKSLTGEVIKVKANQIERWVEQYSELYSKGDTISDDAYETIKSPSYMSKLDELLTIEQSSKAIIIIAHW